MYKEPLYLETDTSGAGLGAVLLQTWDRVHFSHKEAPDNLYKKDWL